MKKTLLTLALICTTSMLFAQRDTIRLRRDKNVNEIVTDRPPQAVYFQLGGSAPIISVNYDTRFSNRVNGLGFTAGLGFWGGSGGAIFSIPASLNYLVGKRSHFIELAAGGTFVTAGTNLFDDESGSIVIGHLNVGYRYQPVTGGFFFRGGTSPLFAQGEYVTSFYLGFGHNF